MHRSLSILLVITLLAHGQNETVWEIEPLALPADHVRVIFVQGEGNERNLVVFHSVEKFDDEGLHFRQPDNPNIKGFAPWERFSACTKLRILGKKKKATTELAPLQAIPPMVLPAKHLTLIDADGRTMIATVHAMTLDGIRITRQEDGEEMRLNWKQLSIQTRRKIEGFVPPPSAQPAPNNTPEERLYYQTTIFTIDPDGRLNGYARGIFYAQESALYQALQNRRDRRFSWDELCPHTVAMFRDNGDDSHITEKLREYEALSPILAKEETARRRAQQMTRLESGLLIARDDAPDLVKKIVEAGNWLQDKGYKRGGGRTANFKDTGYDCSSATSYVLIQAGLLDRMLTSRDFMKFGEPGPGRWVTIYAEDGHVFITIGRWRLDTGNTHPMYGPNYQEPGPRWKNYGRRTDGFVRRHIPGL